MSDWVHIDCMFKIRDRGSSNFDYKKFLKYRKKTLKNIYKAANKIYKVKQLYKYSDRDLRFYIIPDFNTKVKQIADDVYYYVYNDNVVCNICGDIRWETDKGNQFTNLIKDIWYNSNIDIDSGICLIRDYSSGGDKVLIYNSSYQKAIIFRNDLSELNFIDDYNFEVDINEYEGWFKINDKTYLINDVFNDPVRYEKEFYNMGIYIKIVNKNI